MSSVIGVLGKRAKGEKGLHRRAVDWSRVVWIGEAPDGLAHVYFDRFVPGTSGPTAIPDWAAVGVDFDEAVASWREWKGEKGSGWWRVLW